MKSSGLVNEATGFREGIPKKGVDRIQTDNSEHQPPT